jgi:uroporphyrinogen-III synthase
MATPSFHGLRVLALESRRATEIGALITKFGGHALVAPAVREVPLDSNTETIAFADALVAGGFDIVIFLTGVGTRALVNAVERVRSRETFLDALRRVKIVARGPKPLAVLRELNVPVWIAAPEPNTWREVMAALDARSGEQPLARGRVAVQEYGVSNTELLAELEARGAQVTRVPVYQWALPEDVEPLKEAAIAISRGQVDVVILTSSIQLIHLWKIVEGMGLEAPVRRGLERSVLASIGPTTSEELERHGFSPDLEASHPKMGLLVTEAAQLAAGLLGAKRT